MKALLLVALLMPLLLAGCISMGGEVLSNGTGSNVSGNQAAPPEGNASSGAVQNATANDTNVTVTAPEPPPAVYERQYSRGFSFEYPVNGSVQVSPGSYGGIFTFTHVASGQTAEILMVSNLNTTAVYGQNKDTILRADPTKAASDFLLQDEHDDPLGGLLESAYEVGEVKTFGIARDGFAAQAPFRIRFGNSNKSYSGHAISIYVPERSLHVKARIIALDSEKADSIRDNFLLSFRIE